jgi:hypothetical protein
VPLENSQRVWVALGGHETCPRPVPGGLAWRGTVAAARVACASVLPGRRPRRARGVPDRRGNRGETRSLAGSPTGPLTWHRADRDHAADGLLSNKSRAMDAALTSRSLSHLRTCDNFLHDVFKGTPYGRARRPASAGSLGMAANHGGGEEQAGGPPPGQAWEGALAAVGRQPGPRL